MKKTMIRILIPISILCIIYISQCVYLSFKLDKVVQASYNSYGEVNNYSDIVSDEIFDRLNYRRYENEYSVPSIEKNIKTFPITLWFKNRAYSKYKYTYKRVDYEGHSLCGSYEVPVTITWEWKNFKWIITGKYELP